MKKILTYLLTFILCLFCFSSCGSYSKNTFFSNAFLDENKLTDLPVPPHIDNCVMQNDNVLYLNLTKSEYERYVGEVLAYLQAREDIHYLGYSVRSLLAAEMFQYDRIAPFTDSYSVRKDKHDFFFSTEDGLSDRDTLHNPVEIRITRENGKLTYENYQYNTVICILNGIFAEAEWDVCGAEHTYDAGVEYPIPDSEDTVTEYTCVHCGHTEYSNFIGDGIFYRITIVNTDADDYLLYRPDRGISGIIYRFPVQKLTDARIKFTVNGTEIFPRETEDGLWSYDFVMPCSNIVIVIDRV